jgi:hypothetical protein
LLRRFDRTGDQPLKVGASSSEVGVGFDALHLGFEQGSLRVQQIDEAELAGPVSGRGRRKDRLG